MQEISIRVMNMVRRTLLESPDVADRVLYAAAVSLDPSIGNLSLQQFQARYPRHVRRFELGRRPVRGRESSAAVDDVSVAERPDLYAPGKDTLNPGASSAADSLPAEFVARVEEAPSVRAVRRRAGSAAVNQTAEPAHVERARHPLPEPEMEKQPAIQELAVPSESTTFQPWPLRLLPTAAVHEPPKRARTRRAGTRKGPDLRVTPGRAVAEQDDPPAPFAQPTGSVTSAEAAKGSGASPAMPPGRLEKPGGPPLPLRSRSEIRRLLLAWAHELESAGTRGDLVGVLARAHEYVDAILSACALDAAQPQLANVGDFRRPSGPTDRDPPKPRGPERPGRPTVPVRRRIQDYDPAEIDALVRWVTNDDPDSTDDEVVDAVFAELGLRRRGRRIRATIGSSLARVRSEQPSHRELDQSFRGRRDSASGP